MKCNCNCVIRATEIIQEGGTYLITVPAGSFDNLCAFETVQIGLYTSIPRDSVCNLVIVTDGEHDFPISCVENTCDGGVINDLWRTTLCCRTILVTKFAPISETLTLQCVKGRRG